MPCAAHATLAADGAERAAARAAYRKMAVARARARALQQLECIAKRSSTFRAGRNELYVEGHLTSDRHAWRTGLAD
eukprot:1401738-Alexandrium_andersonii.AAC.1